MIRTGRADWYYRVLEPGLIAVGDVVQLDDRPNPDFPFARLVELISNSSATVVELARMQDMAGLASNWRVRARESLTRKGRRPGIELKWADIGTLRSVARLVSPLHEQAFIA